MAFALRSFFLLCGISGLLSGVRSFPTKVLKDVSCPEGWTQLDCHCYIFQAEVRVVADAEAICNILGGNLVSIHSKLENEVVRELIIAGGARGALIGLHNAIETNDYMWTDGTVVDFLDLFPNTPPEDCVLFSLVQGQWLLVSCDATAGYVCIKEAGHFFH
ncbi:snaclec alboaggregin-A subunit beta'-like [Festucalex cinctus]